MKNPAELPLVAITAVCARENGGFAETSAHTWVRIPEGAPFKNYPKLMPIGNGFGFFVYINY